MYFSHGKSDGKTIISICTTSKKKNLKRNIQTELKKILTNDSAELAN